MTDSRPKRNAPTGMRSALQWAALLLGFYVAMHLAAGGMIRLVTGRDASVAIAPGGASGPAVAATSPSATGGERPARTQPVRAIETARECKQGSPIDSDCTLE